MNRCNIILNLILCFTVVWTVTGQEDINFVIVDRELMTIAQNELDTLQSLDYIHERFDADWIDQYLETSIQILGEGPIQNALGDDDRLSDEQMHLLRSAPIGSTLELRVSYIPDNNLISNPKREIDYRFDIVPSVLPKYKGGSAALDRYVASRITDRLDSLELTQMRFSNIAFDVLPDGSIGNVMVLDSTDYPMINDLLNKAVCDMPKWQPARSSDGTAVKHRCRFMISNSKGGCLMY